LLLLACPLMHLFGGHRHGSHRNDRNESDVGGRAGRRYEEVQCPRRHLPTVCGAL
jgi:hypothetical protein